MPQIILLIAVGLILLSLVFFSRGILIVLILLSLALNQSYLEQIRQIGSVIGYLRWVFFALFVFYAFGDIFLRRPVRRIKSFDILAIVFIIYAFLSIAYSPFPKLTFGRAITILALYISVFWVIWKYANEQGPEKVISLILQFMMLICIASYLMIFISPHRAFLFGRFAGIFNNPNALGLLCAIVLPLSLWKFLETKKRTALFLFFLISAALLASGARASLNAIAIAMGYFIYRRAKEYKPLILFSSISFILIAFWIIETVVKKFFLFYIRADSIRLLGGRLLIWPVAIDYFKAKPIFGYGFGVEEKVITTSTLYFPGQLLIQKQFGYYAHSSYLGMLVQLGIVGFIILFSPLFILLFKELSLRQDSSSVPSLRYALQASLIAGLIGGLYESFIYSVGNTHALPFWITVMLLVFYRYQDREKMLEST